jgi:hypothetical protein
MGAVERHDRAIGILTSFLHEAAVLVLVFGILDTYASNKLNRRIGEMVFCGGFFLLFAALAFRSICYRFMRMVIRWTMDIQDDVGGE